MVSLLRRGRMVASIAGICLLGVSAYLFFCWKDILANIYLHRLMQNSSYLTQIIEKPKGSPEREAIRRFLLTSVGRNSLFHAYLDRAFPTLEKFQLLPTPMQAKMAIIRMNDDILTFEEDVDGTWDSRIVARLDEEERSLRRAILALVPSILCESFRVLGRPEAEFKLLDNRNGKLLFQGRPIGNSEIHEDFTCCILNVGKIQPKR